MPPSYAACRVVLLLLVLITAAVLVLQVVTPERWDDTVRSVEEIWPALRSLTQDSA